jgi:integrase
MARPKGKRPTSVKIYEGADGSWHGYLTVGVKPDGRPDRRHRMGKTREEVEQKIRELEDKFLRDELLAPGRAPTLEQFLSDWLTSIKPHVAYKTWKDSYEYSCRLYLVPGLGAHRLDDLEANPKYIDALYTRLLGTEDEPSHLSPGTVALIHRTLRTALNDAVRLKLIKTNPALSARTPESDAEEIKPLTKQEQQQLLDTLTGRRTGCRWLVAMLGIRQGEVLGLRWDDINFGTGIVTIEGKVQRRNWRHGCKDPARCARWKHGCRSTQRCGLDAWRCPKRAVRCRETPCTIAWDHGCDDRSKCRAKMGRACRSRVEKHCPRHRSECPPPCASGCTKHADSCPQRVGGGVHIETVEQRGRKTTRRRLKTKTRAGVRRIGFPREVLDELLAHRERQDAERQHAGSMWVEHGLVFTTIIGMPVDPKRDWEDWKALLAEAGLRDMRPHDARHTAATLLLAKGVDRRVVMDIMGWASEHMLKRYQHVVDEMRTEAATRIGSALFGSAGEPGSGPGSATDHATTAETNVIDFAERKRNRRSAG